MRQLFYILVFLLLTKDLFALGVSGLIFDKENNMPLSGVVVGIDELNLITETDQNGKFSFTDIEPGYYNVFLSHKDYGKNNFKIKVKRDFYIEKSISKKTYHAGDQENLYKNKNKSKGKNSILRKEIKVYPMRGVGDSTHLLQTLPGVGGGFSLATVPIIRGINPLYNKYYIDDFSIDYPFHYAVGIVPVISSINEEAIEKIELEKGTSSIAKSDHLGNVINYKTRMAEEPGVHGKISMDPLIPLFPTFSVYGSPYKDLDFVAVVRRTDIDWLIDTSYTDFYMEDYFYRFTYSLFDSHRVTIIGHGVRDDFNYDKYDAGFKSDLVGLKWEYLINKNFFLKTLISRNTLSQNIVNTQVYSGTNGIKIDFKPQEDKISQELTYNNKSFFIRTGYEFIDHKGGVEGNADISELTQVDFWNITSSDLTVEFPIEGKTKALFLEGGFDWNRFNANMGIRYEDYGPLDNKNISYNAKINYEFKKDTFFYFIHSRYFAHPDMYYYLGQVDPDFEDAESINWQLGSNFEIFKKFNFNLELYYSKLSNLNPSIIYNVADDYYKKVAQIHPFSQEEEGKNYGAEFSITGAYKKYSGWISYSYLKTERSNSTDDDFVSDFDQKHIFRLVLMADYGKWIPSVIFHYYSCLPYTPVTGAVASGDEYNAVYGERNSKRFNANSRVDFKLTYLWGDSNRFYIEMWNVLWQSNKVTYEFDEDENYSSSNPDSVSDIPVFLWLGMELCF